MIRMRVSGVVFSALVILGGVMTARAQSSQPAAPAKAAAATANANATILDIMSTMIVPASKVVFEAVSTETVAGKERQKEPRTDAEWAAVNAAALKIIEGSKLLTVDGRAVARNMNAKPKEGELGHKEIAALLAKRRPEWNEFAKALSEVASAAAKAAQKKDKDGVFNAAGDMDMACENCHLAFWYPDQEKLFKK